jgi:prefoldin beta subunit
MRTNNGHELSTTAFLCAKGGKAVNKRLEGEKVVDVVGDQGRCSSVAAATAPQASNQPGWHFFPHRFLYWHHTFWLQVYFLIVVCDDGRGPEEVSELVGRCAEDSRRWVSRALYVVILMALDLQSAVDARQKLEAQQQENKAVQKEFDGLADEAKIYKLVGPVLLKQDRTEAISAVNGRLDYIGKEIGRSETRIRELQAASNKIQVEMMQIQQKLQGAQQTPANA